MRAAFLLLLLALGSCARPQHPSPYVPPETQYSVGSTLMAAGGLMAAAVGSSFAQDQNASKTVKTAGTAAAVAGTGLMLASLVDAVEVGKQREKFMNLTRAFYRQYYGGSWQEAPEQAAPPPLPELPFDFRDDAPGTEDP